ncbi:MAG: patatin-like phospholipase family protein [Cyanobacteria bacterium P01_F01_bin.150]
MTFKILSLDGGGIRGVLSARILKEVEKTLKEQTNQSLHDYFDLIAGTSTGSILAAGIACGMTANQLINIYQEEGHNIFLKSVRQQRKWRFLGKLLGNRVLYPHKKGMNGLSQVLKRHLIHPASGKCPTIGTIKHPNLLILAYDVLSRNTTWFSNDPANENSWYSNLGLWQICSASASAPTYFPPYELPYYGQDNQKLPHIDGGVSANAPELVAIAHALLISQRDPNNQLSMNDISVLSIGTGRTTRPYTYDEIKKWGQLDWVMNLPSIFMDPSSEISTAISRQIMESIDGKRYLRLNFDLNNRKDSQSQEIDRRKRLDKPYNQYIAQKTLKKIELSEEIDDPNICDELIEAASCYLHYGDVSYNHETVSVRPSIQKIIESNSCSVSGEK